MNQHLIWILTIMALSLGFLVVLIILIFMTNIFSNTKHEEKILQIIILRYTQKKI